MFAPKRLIIKGGKVVNADSQFDADVFIEGEKIKLVGLDLVIPRDTKIIDARGKWIIPGGINAHTHLTSSFSETRHDIYMATRAALAGGTTTIINFVDDQGKSIVEAYNKCRTLADEEMCCDYSFHVVVGSISENTCKDMEILALEKGINSFVLCAAYRELINPFDFDDFLRLIYTCQKVGALASFHIKDFDLSLLHRHACLESESKITNEVVEKHLADSTPEVIDILKVIAFASQVRCPLNILQIQSITAAEILRKISTKDCPMYGEARLSSAVSKSGSQLKYSGEKQCGYLSSPALSEQENTTLHLMNMLSKGTLQNVGIDGCGLIEDDDVPVHRNYTNFIRSIENRMSFVWEKALESGNVTPSTFVSMTSTSAAKMYNLYPNKVLLNIRSGHDEPRTDDGSKVLPKDLFRGHIQAESDADLVVWDPDGYRSIPRQDRLPFNNDLKVFEGMKIKGKPIYVIYRGKVVVENERPMEVKPGSGRFIPTLPFAPFVYLPIKLKAASITKESDTAFRDISGTMFHSGSGDETEIHRQSVSRDKRQKEESQGVKDALATGGNSLIKTENGPGDTRLTESNFSGNNKPEPPIADVASDDKSDITAGDKNIGADQKGRGDDEGQKSQAVTRKPTQMDAIFNTSAANQDEKTSQGKAKAEGDLLLTATSERAMSSGEFRRRPPTRSGGRNLLDSTFSLSGAQIDDDKKSRPTIRVQNPPGGRSSGIWYS